MVRDHVLHAGLCGRKLRCAHQPVGGDAPPLSELLSNNEGLRDVSSPVLRSTFLHLGMLLFQMLASATSGLLGPLIFPVQTSWRCRRLGLLSAVCQRSTLRS